MKRGTKLLLTSEAHNGGQPFVVSYFKKVRNSDVLVEVSFPFVVGGGGVWQVQRFQLKTWEELTDLLARNSEELDAFEAMVSIDASRRTRYNYLKQRVPQLKTAVATLIGAKS